MTDRRKSWTGGGYQYGYSFRVERDGSITQFVDRPGLAIPPQPIPSTTPITDQVVALARQQRGDTD